MTSMSSQPTSVEEKHLDWSAKQGRILTDRGDTLKHYSEGNGFPFSAEELPHHHLQQGDSNDIFRKWSRQFLSSADKSPIVGVWKRPLFAGKWEHSTEEDETVFNIQTGTLFIDLRIPKSKPVQRWDQMVKQSNLKGMSSRRVLESFTDYDLRLYARQHVFGGISVVSHDKSLLPHCTRHHCMDWNYFGTPRPRPNKWYIEGDYRNDEKSFNVWNEWSYAKDGHGQSYYYECWERLPGDEGGNGLRLALRKRKIGHDGQHVDGIIVAVGDHFNYMFGRELMGDEKKYPNANSLVELVDAAIANGDRDTAISYLSLEAGHGTISSGWMVDCSIQSWKHGMKLENCIQNKDHDLNIKVTGNGSDLLTWEVAFGSTIWDVYECSLASVEELQSLLQKSAPESLDSRL